MNQKDIAFMRLQAQGLKDRSFKNAADCVAYFGAMQAQDFNMSKWALGIRIKNATTKKINDAIDKGGVLRTHVLRPTWHLVSPQNIYWMTELTGQRIKAAMKSRDKQLELTEKIILQSRKVLEKKLLKEINCTREDLAAALQKVGINTSETRALHLLMHAEISGLICSGRFKNSKPSYALLEERVKKPSPLSREESLAKLAAIYFNGHAPATARDFAWWSGLSLSDAKLSLELVKNEVNELKIMDETYYSAGDFKVQKQAADTLQLLPAFDEYIISYKDRSAALHNQHFKKAISTNGIFYPTIILNGQAVGTWKSIKSGNKVSVQATFFLAATKPVRLLLEKAALEYALFLGKEIELTMR